jgi:nitroreductase
LTLTALSDQTMSSALHRAAARATLAPSIHNTQPWRFVVRAGQLDVYADRSSAVPVIDPTGRQLTISCGAAIFGARVSLAASNVEAVTMLLPDPTEPDLLASIVVIGAMPESDPDALRLDAAAEVRHSNRRQFDATPVPDAVVDRLTHAAEIEGAWLAPVRDLADRVAVAVLSQRADARQNTDPAYRAELREWTSVEPGRDDGIPAAAIPHTTGAAHDDVPIRDFDTRGAGELPPETRSRLDQTMGVLGTSGDDERNWLIAGQALGRILLELTTDGYVATILSQVAEEPDTRQQLRQDLRLDGQVALLLRIGVAAPATPTPRRPLDQVVTDA